MSLSERMETIARTVVKREASHQEELDRAREKARTLHATVEEALGRFNAIVAEDLPDLRVELTPPRIDDKHLRSIEFDLERGRHRAIVLVKSKGEVTLVGPFRTGKNEGPCRTFPFEADDELDDALGDFLERFLEEAAAP